jgi:hypothetical protein
MLQPEMAPFGFGSLASHINSLAAAVEIKSVEVLQAFLMVGSLLALQQRSGVVVRLLL